MCEFINDFSLMKFNYKVIKRLLGLVMATNTRIVSLNLNIYQNNFNVKVLSANSFDNETTTQKAKE